MGIYLRDRSRRLTVEECACLSATSVARQAGWNGGVVTLHVPDDFGEGDLRLVCAVNLATRVVQVSLRGVGDLIADKQRIKITPSRLPWNRVRWWFCCPMPSLWGDKPCGRRVAALYLLPGGRRLGCRQCQRLTYRSCQRSHCFDGIHAMAALSMGVDPAAIDRMMRWEARGRRTLRRL